MNVNRINREKKQDIRMPHMFRNTNANRQESVPENDFLAEHQDNLAKILKSYRNNNHTSNQGSILDSIKNLMFVENSDESVNIYLDTLKAKYLIKDEEITEEIESNDIVEHIEEVEKEEILAPSEDIDFSDILKTSELEILNTKDQKFLLQSLINDINLNSTTNNQYDDKLFQKNMEEIINETLSETKEEPVINEEKVEEAEVIIQKKKRKLPFVLFILIIVLLGIAGYIYKDMILELLNNLS